MSLAKTGDFHAGHGINAAGLVAIAPEKGILDRDGLLLKLTCGFNPGNTR